MKTVNFWVIRHGHKDPEKDALSDKGFEQVKASAKHNLNNVKFDAAFFSGMHRVKETAETVLSTLGQNVPLTADQGFGFGWAADEKRWPYKEATNQVEAAKAAGAEETADLWMEKWPPALMVRGRLLGSLLYRAQALADSVKKDEINVLVGSHSPTSELAALDPKTTPRLRETDVMKYVVEIGNEGPKITKSEVLRAPY
jgi:broad specificity phosphatase PhoE